MCILASVLVVGHFAAAAITAQSPPAPDELATAAQECITKVAPGMARVTVVACAGENRIAVYQRHNWPFMDLVYEYEAIKLRIASDADAGKISQEEYTVKMRAASSDYRADRSPLSNITAT